MRKQRIARGICILGTGMLAVSVVMVAQGRAYEAGEAWAFNPLIVYPAMVLAAVAGCLLSDRIAHQLMRRR